MASSTTGKHRSPVWADFDELKETIDGEEKVIAICKFYKSWLSTNSAHGTRHLLRHQKSCKKKADPANMVQSRLALNPNGSYRNWEYRPNVARAKLCRLVAR